MPNQEFPTCLGYRTETEPAGGLTDDVFSSNLGCYFFQVTGIAFWYCFLVLLLVLLFCIAFLYITLIAPSEFIFTNTSPIYPLFKW
jgi:hypothetical protein